MPTEKFKFMLKGSRLEARGEEEMLGCEEKTRRRRQNSSSFAPEKTSSSEGPLVPRQGAARQPLRLTLALQGSR